MDVSQFYTLNISQGKDSTINAAGGLKAALGNALPGQNFLDFILAELDRNAQPAVQNAPAPSQPSGQTVLPDEAAALREEIKSWMLDPNSELAQALAMNQEALDAALGTINDGLITTANVEAGSPQLLQALMVETEDQATVSPDMNISPALEKLQAVLNKLEALVKNGKAGELTLANLAPADITDIQEKIKSLLNKATSNALDEEQKRKALDGIYLGLIKLVSPPDQATASIAVQAAVQDVQNDQANKVNDLTRPAPQKTPDAPNATPNAWAQQGADEGTGQNTTGSDKFSDLLRDFSGKKSSPQLEANINAPGVKPDFSALQGWPFDISGSIFAPADWSQMPYETIGGQSPALTLTSLGTLTNLVTQAHAATVPHPVIQTVAATISKAAATGETKNIVLQLDPPELGRVEVRMSFGKDKTVKAVLLAEKPETLAMLQRDAHSLERALFTSGLDVDSSGLSFGMAQEGYDFNQQGGGNDSNRYSSKENGPEDIIESTMTWRVDPDTGHMRYNILA